MRKLAGFAIVLAVLVLGYAAVGPVLTIHSISRAIQAHDTEQLADDVDFATLRTNLKEQINAALMAKAGSTIQDNPLAALGMAFASTVVDSVVEGFVTPSGLASLMEGRKPRHDRPRPDLPPGQDPRLPDPEPKKPFEGARYTYDSPWRFSVWVKANNGDEIRFVLTRDWLRWRLTNIVVPVPV